MIDFNRLNAAKAESARIAEAFSQTHDVIVVEGVSFYVLASDIPEIHPLDVMKAGLDLISEEPATTASILADEELCRELITAKQTI